MLNHSPKQCCGCTACAAICPQSCISIQEDSEGFLYPHIDQEICVHCGMCETVCPIYAYKSPQDSTPSAYAAVNLDNETRDKSSSGGIFSLLAMYVLDKQGIVFGAALDDDLQVKHMAICSPDELYKFQGSKYVQSDLRGIYKQVKTYLQQEKYVLFSGTPCQIEGLRLFLQRDYPNLFLVDIICHGVPSPLVWREYLKYIRKAYQKQIKNIHFRDKKDGWLKFCTLIQFTDDTIKYIERNKDCFMKAFLTNISLRPSCSTCLFKTKARNSDITLADFWGIEQVLPAMHDDRGTSLLVIHSEKGQRLLHAIEKKCRYQSVNLDAAVECNSAMIHSVAAHPKRNIFFSLLGNFPFDKLVNKQCRPKHTIKNAIRHILDKFHLLEIAKRVKLHIKK